MMIDATDMFYVFFYHTYVAFYGLTLCTISLLHDVSDACEIVFTLISCYIY